jgi:orotate phosphoribosyltransferase
MILIKILPKKQPRLLLQINAIKLNPNPLRGLRDGNHLFTVIIGYLSFPVIRNYVRDEFSKNIEKQLVNLMLLPE